MRFKTVLPDGWDFEEIRTIECIEAIRPLWCTLLSKETCPSLDADIDRYISVLKGLGNVLPYILLLKYNNQPRAMIIGRLEKHAIALRLGYKTLLRPEMNCLTVVYGGVIGDPNESISSFLIQRLKKIWREKRIDIIYFNHLGANSTFLRQIRRESNIFVRSYFPVIYPHWRMSIPQSINDVYQSMSKKHRGNLRRAIKKFEDEWVNRFQIIHCHNSADIELLSKDVETISVKTYQHQLNAGFTANSLTKSILTADADAKRMFVSLFYIEKQPCAFQWGTVFGNTYFLEKIGYDPHWSRSMIGSILFLKVLELVCEDKSLKYLDFGFGDADYKRSYGNDQWEELSIYLFAPRIYPVVINQLYSMMSGLSFALSTILKKTKLIARIKRFWRNRLLSSSDGEQPEKDAQA